MGAVSPRCCDQLFANQHCVSFAAKAWLFAMAGAYRNKTYKHDQGKGGFFPPFFFCAIFEIALSFGGSSRQAVSKIGVCHFFLT
jgi:hypothetical protein